MCWYSGYVCYTVCVGCVFCFFKQKTAYEMRISDWSSDVCSSDLVKGRATFYAELFVSLRDFLHCSAPPNQNYGCREYKHKNGLSIYPSGKRARKRVV